MKRSSDWRYGNGKPLTESEIDALYAPGRTCRHCGEPMNTAEKNPRVDVQTESEIRALVGTATHVLSFGGPLPIECFIEHHKAFLNYVRYVRHGNKLIEADYPADVEKNRTRSSYVVYGIWPLINKEYATGRGF